MQRTVSARHMYNRIAGEVERERRRAKERAQLAFTAGCVLGASGAAAIGALTLALFQ